MSKFTPEWLTAAFTLVMAVTGIWALVYASSQLRQAREEAQLQRLLDLDKEYRSEPMITYRRVAAQKRLAGQDEPNEEDEMLDFFETVALFANRGQLKDIDVWEAFGSYIFPLYADARDDIEQDQKQHPADYTNLVTLMPRLETIEQAHGSVDAKPSKEDVHDYWETESQLEAGPPVTRRRRAGAK